MKRNRFWKAFFFLMVAMTVGGFLLPYLVPWENAGETFEDLALLPLYIAQLVGLFGLAYSRAIGTRRIWQLIFYATLVETAWALYGLATEVPPAELGSSFVILVAVVVGPFIALVCLGLYLYAFRASDAWSKDPTMRAE